MARPRGEVLVIDRPIGGELVYQVLVADGAGQELVGIASSARVGLRSSQIVYQLSSAAWTFMPLLEFLLHYAHYVLVEVALAFGATTHALALGLV